MKFNYFQDNLNDGYICEERIKEKFKEIFTPILNHILYKEDPEIQKKGIDFTVSKRPVSFDVKCRDYEAYKYKDILLETVSVREYDKLGWLWTSESDVIVYVWQNRSKTKFIDGYLLFLNEIRSWLKEVGTDQFEKVISYSIGKNGVIWSTENIAIPISAFPKNCIKRIDLADFTPYEQSVLNSWFELKKGGDKVWKL